MQDRFEFFIKEITAVYRAVQQIKSMEMTGLGLKGMHVMCLYFLNKHEDGLTAAQLSEMCAEDKASISRTIATLTEKGYVTQEQLDRSKKYRNVISLTQQGREIGRLESEKIIKAFQAGGDGLDDECRKNFYTGLELISKNLRNYSEKIKKDL